MQRRLLTFASIWQGLMFTVVYNISAGILRATGDSTTPVLTLLFTCCINIVLDIFLVVVFQLGVAGVSIATVIAQFISVSIMYRIISRKNWRGVFFCPGGGPIWKGAYFGATEPGDPIGPAEFPDYLF